MIKGLADSVGTYIDKNVGEKTKQKNAQQVSHKKHFVYQKPSG